MAIQLTNSLKEEYKNLFYECQLLPSQLYTIENTCKKIKNNKLVYKKVELVPWYIVGVIHQMESSGNFKTHLHNGDPLTDRTVRVPKGRPKLGNPPFNWEDSAKDALSDKKIPTFWDIPNTLYFLEGYNGFGYREHHPTVKSPYLWAGSSIYKSGKYVADGKFDYNAVSKQIGCAVLLKYMNNNHWFEWPDYSINLDETKTPILNLPQAEKPIIVPPSLQKNETKDDKKDLLSFIIEWFSSFKIKN